MLFQLNPQLVNAQFLCDTEMDESGNLSESETCYISEGCKAFIPYSNHWSEFTGQIEVKVNFHFIRTGNHGLNFGRTDANVTPVDTNWTGKKVAEAFIHRINTEFANSMQDYLQIRDENGNIYNPPIDRLDRQGNPIPNLADTKIRVNLYSDPTNELDTFGGVWFHYLEDIYWRTSPPEPEDSACSVSQFERCGDRTTLSLSSLKNQFSVYGGDVIDIFVYDEHWNCDGCYSGRGVAGMTVGAIGMANIWYYFNKSGYWPLHFTGTLWHEIGHMFDLSHTFSGGSCCQADERDLRNPLTETNAWNNTNNVMGYNACQCVYAPCQLDNIFNFAYHRFGSTIKWGSITGNFDDIAALPTSPLDTIFITDSVYWESPRDIHGIVFIKPGGRLFINNTTIKFTEPSLIQVDRGALLQAKNTTLTRYCESNSFWSGIRVAGNTGRNHPDFINEDFNQDNQDPGRVVLLDSTIIESARWAIITDYIFEYRPDHWGGYIYSNGAEFKNCHRAAAFMKYERPNKSKFLNTVIRSTVTTTENSQFPGSTGVSIWACNGINFVNCQFSNLDVYGIFTIDGSFLVSSGNIFENIGGEGVHISRSSIDLPDYADVSIGSMENSEGMFNLFSGRFNHVRISGYGGLTRGVRIYKNEFEGTYSLSSPQNQNVSILANGSPAIDIYKNKFTKNHTAISVLGTGDRINSISDNIVDQANTGIWYRGINKRAAFACNFFSNYSQAAVYVQGTINETQGNITTSSANYWNRSGVSGTDIFVTRGGADTVIDNRSLNADTLFKYNILDTIGFNHPLRPRCNLTDQTILNPCTVFYNYTTPAVVNLRVCERYENLIEDGEEMELDLATLRFKTDSISTNVLDYQNDPFFLKLKYAKDFKIEDSLSVLIQNEQFSNADALLSAELDTRYKRMRYSLKLLQSDFSGAATLLNTLSSIEEDDDDFYETQLVNIKRLSIPQYYPDSSEWATLEGIAEKSSSSGAYAKAIITYYDARSWFTDFPEYPEDTIPQRPVSIDDPIKDLTNSERKIYPNPSTGRIMLEVQAVKNEKHLLQVRSPLGITVHSSDILQSRDHTMVEIDLSHLLPGLYLVSLSRDSKPVGTRPLFIQK